MEASSTVRKTTCYPLSNDDVDKLISFLGGTPSRDTHPQDNSAVVAKRCRDTGQSGSTWNLTENISFECSHMNEQCEVNCRNVSLTGPDGETVIYEMCDVVDRRKAGSGSCVLFITEPDPNPDP